MPNYEVRAGLSKSATSGETQNFRQRQVSFGQVLSPERSRHRVAGRFRSSRPVKLKPPPMAATYPLAMPVALARKAAVEISRAAGSEVRFKVTPNPEISGWIAPLPG